MHSSGLLRLEDVLRLVWFMLSLFKEPKNKKKKGILYCLLSVGCSLSPSSLDLKCVVSEKENLYQNIHVKIQSK